MAINKRIPVTGEVGSRYLAVDVSFTPLDLEALRTKTFVGDPIRTAIESEAEKEDREVDWDTVKVWKNLKPGHPGIDIRVFVLAPKRETTDE